MIKKFTRSEIYFPAYNNWPEEKQKQAEQDAIPLDVQINKWERENQQFEVLNAFIVHPDTEAWVVYKDKGTSLT